MIKTMPSPQKLLKQVHILLKARNNKQAEQSLAALVEKHPKYFDARTLQIRLRDQAGDDAAVKKLFKLLFAQFPRNEDALFVYALYMHDHRNYSKSIEACNHILTLNNRSAIAHNLIGMCLVNSGTLERAESHFRRAVYFDPRAPLPPGRLATVLRTLGRFDEAEHFFRIAMSLDPLSIDVLQSWIKMEEARKDFAKAREVLNYALSLQPKHPINLLSEAMLLRREKQLDKALACLDNVDPDNLPANGKTLYYFERGKILDDLQRYPDAFAAYRLANEEVKQREQRVYDVDKNRRELQACKAFFTRERMLQLPRATARSNEAVPIFIAGFPRSGTSMVEQILSSHSNITAGDELVMMGRISHKAAEWMGSRQQYPECLSELTEPGKEKNVQNFRNHYINTVQEMGIMEPWGKRFTDKMPLNEVHLGLINLVFPDAPVIHVLRHPLDVIVSAYCNNLYHGDNYALDLQTAAKHYIAVMELVEHYQEQLDQPYLAIRYEDIVDNVEDATRKMLEFLDEPWQQQCVDFHLNKRASKTASYAQVKEKVYTSSVSRYKNYEEFLKPIIPQLEPIIHKLGYTLD